MSNFWIVLIGALLIGGSTSIVGVWLVLRRESLKGDVLAHGVLPGIAIAFLLYPSKNILFMLSGASISALVALQTMNLLQKYTKLKLDTQMALVLSFFFALGLWLLVKIQFLGNSSKSGLESFIFGKMASMLPKDIFNAFLVFILVASINFLYKKRLFWATFDENFTKSIGISVVFTKNLLTIMTVATIVVGLQAVGIVMMAAMLVTPAAVATFMIKNNLNKIFIVSGLISMISIFLGTLLSYFFPKTPTGPWVVVICSLIAFIVIFLSKNIKREK
ncbi:MAG: metal ABC transporter permease [Thermonemataceae bacterium]|nr:metal ABC transporter permease [Thermonemataceae bacterium]